MSLSDCEACWSTPCECGFQGYLVIRDRRLPKLSCQEFEQLRKQLRLHLLKLLRRRRPAKAKRRRP